MKLSATAQTRLRRGFARLLNDIGAKPRRAIASGRVRNKRDRRLDLETVRAALADAQKSSTVAPELS